MKTVEKLKLNLVDADRKYRIIRLSVKRDEKYFLQRKTFFGWSTVSGYQRGAHGEFAYQFDGSSNPFFFVEHTINEVESEREFLSSSIGRFKRIGFFMSRPPRIKRRIIECIYLPTDLLSAVNEHRKNGYNVVNPYPGLKGIPCYDLSGGFVA